MAPLVSQLLLVMARVNRQHDYDSVVLDNSRDLASPRHVTSSQNNMMSSVKLAESTVLCRICERSITWDELEQHTKECGRECENGGLSAQKASINDFQVFKSISAGAFGSTHLARRIATGDMFCIKRLRKVDMLRKNQVDHVKREQHILAQTRNPFVVKLYYSFQSQKVINAAHNPNPAQLLPPEPT